MRSGAAVFLFFLLISSSVLAEEIRYDSGGRRDCFVPLVSDLGFTGGKKVSATEIHIEGIIFDPNGESLVLINNEFYREGDHVNGANVITIFQDRVILSQADEEKTVWIREENVSPGAITNAP